MGWEDVILPRLAKAIATFPEISDSLPEPFHFSLDRRATKDLSPNHYEMGMSYDLLRAAMIGSNTAYWQYRCFAYQHLLNLHLREIGLWTSEQFTGAPHGGFYLSSLVAARMAMIVARNRSLIPIPHELITDLDEYTYRVIQYLTAAATPTGEVICCGERMPKGPYAGQQSAFYRELIGIPHPADEARKIKRQINKPGDYYWLSLRGLRKLIDAGDHIRAIADQIDRSSLPFTAHQVTIERYPHGHTAYYSEGRANQYAPNNGDGTCSWVRVVYSTGEVQWGPRTALRKTGSIFAGKPQSITTSKRGITMPPTTVKIPTTLGDLDTAAKLPFHEGNALISRADKSLVEQWGRRNYGANFGNGYLHSTDHYGALKVLFDREPTYREVYDSYHSGSKNIDAARVKSSGGLRPSEWDNWDDNSKRYAVLVHRYGITRGSRILDGKMKDPFPIDTQKQIDDWNHTVMPKPVDPPITDPTIPPIEPEPNKPKTTDPFVPPTEPPSPVNPVPIGSITGSITLSIDGVTRRFAIREEP